MPWQPGESGNPAGPPKKAKLWRDAINRAIKRREDADPLALEKLADQLLVKVAEGDVAAIKEFGDRLDGKPAQAHVGGDDDDTPIQHTHRIERVIVDPPNRDSKSVQTAS
jgi:hypothetical protein